MFNAIFFFACRKYGWWFLHKCILCITLWWFQRKFLTRKFYMWRLLWLHWSIWKKWNRYLLNYWLKYHILQRFFFKYLHTYLSTINNFFFLQNGMPKNTWSVYLLGDDLINIWFHSKKFFFSTEVHS